MLASIGEGLGYFRENVGCEQVEAWIIDRSIEVIWEDAGRRHLLRRNPRESECGAMGVS